MGKILYEDPNRIAGKYDDPDPIIILDNWRAIKESDGGIIVILHTCERFFIHNLTMEMFHDINDNNKEHKSIFNYIEENLTCRICHGRGILDWIDNITKFVRYEDGMMESYKRNPETPIRELDDFYISSPIVDDTHQVCKTCHGTGLHMFNENAYLEKIESQRRDDNE